MRIKDGRCTRRQRPGKRSAAAALAQSDSGASEKPTTMLKVTFPWSPQHSSNVPPVHQALKIVVVTVHRGVQRLGGRPVAPQPRPSWLSIVAYLPFTVDHRPSSALGCTARAGVPFFFSSSPTATARSAWPRSGCIAYQVSS